MAIATLQSLARRTKLGKRDWGGGGVFTVHVNNGIVEKIVLVLAKQCNNRQLNKNTLRYRTTERPND